MTISLPSDSAFPPVPAAGYIFSFPEQLCATIRAMEMEDVGETLLEILNIPFHLLSSLTIIASYFVLINDFFGWGLVPLFISSLFPYAWGVLVICGAISAIILASKISKQAQFHTHLNTYHSSPTEHRLLKFAADFFHSSPNAPLSQLSPLTIRKNTLERRVRPYLAEEIFSAYRKSTQQIEPEEIETENLTLDTSWDEMTIQSGRILNLQILSLIVILLSTVSCLFFLLAIFSIPAYVLYALSMVLGIVSYILHHGYFDTPGTHFSLCNLLPNCLQGDRSDVDPGGHYTAIMEDGI